MVLRADGAVRICLAGSWQGDGNEARLRWALDAIRHHDGPVQLEFEPPVDLAPSARAFLDTLVRPPDSAE